MAPLTSQLLQLHCGRRLNKQKSVFLAGFSAGSRTVSLVRLLSCPSLSNTHNTMPSSPSPPSPPSPVFTVDNGYVVICNSMCPSVHPSIFKRSLQSGHWPCYSFYKKVSAAQQTKLRYPGDCYQGETHTLYQCHC